MKTRADAIAYVAAETNKRGKVSQRGRILRLLLSAPEVELPKILDLRIGQYCARIVELRAEGFRIVNRTEHVAGVVRSIYALDFPPGVAAPDPAMRETLGQAPTPNPESGDWFEQATGCKRPPLIAPAVHSLGPLFAESSL